MSAPYEVVMPNGVVIRCASAEDAISLAHKLGGEQRDDTNSRRRPPGRSRGDGLATTIAWFKAVRRAGRKGISSRELADEIGLGGARGLGSLSGHARRHLEPSGIDFDALFTIERTKNGVLWFATPELSAAIEALENVMQAKVAAEKPNSDEETPP
jgi:hypothetical protein